MKAIKSRQSALHWYFYRRIGNQEQAFGIHHDGIMAGRAR